MAFASPRSWADGGTTQAILACVYGAGGQAHCALFDLMLATQPIEFRMVLTYLGRGAPIRPCHGCLHSINCPTRIRS